MEIIVPLDKPPLPHPRSHFVNVVRVFAIFGFLSYVLLFSMILSEGKVGFPALRPSVELAGVGFAGMLLTYRLVRWGGVIILAAMIVALLFTSGDLLEWRVWLYGVEAYSALIGLLFLLAPRAHGKKHDGATT